MQILSRLPQILKMLAPLLLFSCASSPSREYDRLFNEGLEEMRLGNFSTAKSNFTRILDAHPGRRANEVKFVLAICESGLGNRSEARRLYREIIDSSSDRSLVGQARQRLGLLELRAQDYSAAAQNFKGALEKAEEHEKPRIRLHLGVALQRQGEFDSARKIFNKLLQGSSPSQIMEEARQQLRYPDYFTVQAGAFGKRDNATQHARALKQAGFDAHIRESHTGGKTLHRVWVGRFPRRSDAKVVRDRLMASSAVPKGTKLLVLP